MSLHFLLTALTVVLIPGTGVLYTVAVGLGRGRVAAAWAALGSTIGIVPHIAMAGLGLATLLHTSALAFQVVKAGGVLYLLWLAWQALRQDGALDIAPDRAPESGLRTALRGALINVLNPKLSVFFLALLPPFLSGDPARATAEMAMLGSVFMAMTLGVFVVYGALASLARTHVLSRPTAMRWMSRGIAGLFAALAARLALERA